MSEYYGPSRTDASSLIKWLLLLVVLIAIAAVAAFALGWIATPLDTVSADNIRRLSQAANDAWSGLEAQLSNISNVEQRANDMVVQYGEDRSQWPQGKSDEYLQLRQQVTNAISSYNTACGQYNAMWNDEWQAIPAPDDLPTHCDMYSQ